MMLNMQQLSPRQRRLYQFITNYQSREGRPPTYAEMQSALGISSKSLVRYHLDVLVRQGLLDRVPSVARGARRLPPAGTSGSVRVPLRGQLDAAVALPPVEAALADEVTEALELSRALAPDWTNLYALRVRGSGLLDAMLSDGDIVVMRPAVDARDGELVAVRLRDRGNVVLKRWRDMGDRIRLSSDDPRVAPIYARRNQLEVQGAVVAVIRQV